MTRHLVLTSDASTVCGVEAFARNIVAHAGGRAEAHVLDGDLGHLSQRLKRAEGIVLNFPLVAWKKRLIAPLAAALVAKWRRRKVTVVLHEWASLDWKRRLVLRPVLMLADALLFSAPEVEREWRDSLLSGRRTVPTSVIPIPPNLLPEQADAETPASAVIGGLRAGSRTIIGQFGSIYPKKNCAELLEIARVLVDGGTDVGVAFIGSFIKGLDTVEEDFRRQVAARGLADRVVVTGYLKDDAEVFSACRAVDIFCYRFLEGLTSRRGSVLAAALAGRIVVTNAPADPGSLEHHGLFKSLIANGNIVLCAHDADPPAMAEAMRQVIGRCAPPVDIERQVDLLWQDIIGALERS